MRTWAVRDSTVILGLVLVSVLLADGHENIY